MRTWTASLLMTAMLLFGAAEGQAQVPRACYGMDYPTRSVHNYDLGGETGGSDFDTWHTHAQGFVTGGNERGYDLNQVWLRMSTGSLNGGSMSVELWSATGEDPNARIASFTNGGTSLAIGAACFLAPSGTTLSPNTRYFIYAKYSGSSDYPSWQTTATNTDTSTTGWTVDDRRRRRISDTDAWDSESEWALVFEGIWADEIPPNQPPIVTIEPPMKTTLVRLEPVELRGNATDPDGSVHYVLWDGSGVFDDVFSATTTWRASFALEHNLDFTATDREGAETTATITITVHEAPSVEITRPASTTVRPGVKVQLASTATDDGEITLYAWEGLGMFNDNTLPNPTWTAPTVPGTYNLTLTVADNHMAESSETLVMTVQSDDPGESEEEEEEPVQNDDPGESEEEEEEPVPVPALPLAGAAVLALLLVLRGVRRLSA